MNILCSFRFIKTSLYTAVEYEYVEKRLRIKVSFILT